MVGILKQEVGLLCTHVPDAVSACLLHICGIGLATHLQELTQQPDLLHFKPDSPLLALPPNVGRSAELLHMPKLNSGMGIAVSLVAFQV